MFDDIIFPTIEKENIDFFKVADLIINNTKIFIVKQNYNDFGIPGPMEMANLLDTTFSNNIIRNIESPKSNTFSVVEDKQHINRPTINGIKSHILSCKHYKNFTFNCETKSLFIYLWMIKPNGVDVIKACEYNNLVFIHKG